MTRERSVLLAAAVVGVMAASGDDGGAWWWSFLSDFIRDMLSCSVVWVGFEFDFKLVLLMS